MTGLFCLVFGLAAGWWIEHRRQQTIDEQSFWNETQVRAFAEAADRLYVAAETAGRDANHMRNSLRNTRATLRRQDAILKGQRR